MSWQDLTALRPARGRSMTWEDPALDPVPPGHGEPRLPEGSDGTPVEQRTPFDTPVPWPASKPPEMFGVPQCGKCWYFHTPEEGCR